MGTYLCRTYCTVSRHSQLPNVKISAHNAHTHTELTQKAGSIELWQTEGAFL